MSRARGAATLAALLAITTTGAAAAAPVSVPEWAPASAPASTTAQVRVDAHMHVHSPQILAFLPDYCSSPGRSGKCDPRFIAALTADDALAQLDAAGIATGQLMSTGYLAESPMMVPARTDAAQLLRGANAFTVNLATRNPRFRAFIGINPMTSTALPEIAHWAGNPHVAGVKIHVTNSRADLRAPEQLATLAGVFRACDAAGLAVAIHLRTFASDYGAVDVANFLRVVRPAAGDTPVQIAHAGGWGGLDGNTFAALGAFADALERDPALGRQLYFDLAMVFDQDTSQADLDRLAVLVRRIGVEHFLPGSDWPFSGDLDRYYGQTYPRLPLSEAEWRTLRSNVLPLR